MDCFICGVHYDSIRFMSIHFRLFHELPEKHNYQCTFQNCNTLFGSLSSLTRHYKCHIQTPADNNQNKIAISRNHDPPTLPINSSADLLCSKISQLVQPIVDSASVSDLDQSPILSSNKILQNNVSIDDYGIQFTLKLHNNNNFTRKDVLKIQKSVINDIVKPIVGSVDTFFKQHCDTTDLEHRLQLTSLLQNISNPFGRWENEQQLFFNWLSENDYASGYEEFIINKEIGENTAAEKLLTIRLTLPEFYGHCHFNLENFWRKTTCFCKYLQKWLRSANQQC